MQHLERKSLVGHYSEFQLNLNNIAISQGRKTIFYGTVFQTFIFFVSEESQQTFVYMTHRGCANWLRKEAGKEEKYELWF